MLKGDPVGILAAAEVIRHLAKRSARWREHITVAGGIPPLLALLKAAQHPVLVESAAAAVRNLAIEEVSRKLLQAAGAVGPVIAALVEAGGGEIKEDTGSEGSERESGSLGSRGEHKRKSLSHGEGYFAGVSAGTGALAGAVSGGGGVGSSSGEPGITRDSKHQNQSVVEHLSSADPAIACAAAAAAAAGGGGAAAGEDGVMAHATTHSGTGARFPAPAPAPLGVSSPGSTSHRRVASAIQGSLGVLASGSGSSSSYGSGNETSFAIQEHAAAILFSLAKSDDMKKEIGRLGAIPPLVRLFSSSCPTLPLNSPSFSFHVAPTPPHPLPPHSISLRVLYYLSVYRPNKALIVAAGAVPCLLSVVREQDSKSMLADDCVLLLTSLAAVREGQEAIVESGGIAVLGRVLEDGTMLGRENAGAALLLLARAEGEWLKGIVAEAVLPSLLEIVNGVGQSNRARAKDSSPLRLGSPSLISLGDGQLKKMVKRMFPPHPGGGFKGFWGVGGGGGGSVGSGGGAGGGGGGGSVKTEVLAFEIGSVMRRSLEIYDCMGEKTLASLRSNLQAPGVVTLISSDLRLLWNLAGVEKLLELQRVAARVAVLGRKCRSARLHTLGDLFPLLLSPDSDLSHFAVSPAEADALIKFMREQAEATERLKSEMEAIQQLHHRIQEYGEWNKLQDMVAQVRPAGAAGVLAWKPRFGMVVRRGRYGMVSQARPVRCPRYVHPFRLCHVAQGKSVEKLQSHCLWSFDLDYLLQLLVAALCMIRRRIFTSFGPPPSSASPSAPSLAVGSLGAWGLALHYANVVVLLERIIQQPDAVMGPTRDELYDMLPRSIQHALRCQLQDPENFLPDGRVEANLKRGLLLLPTMAHNTIFWQSLHTPGTLMGADEVVFQVQTFYYACKEAVDAALIDVLLGPSNSTMRCNICATHTLSKPALPSLFPSTPFSLHHQTFYYACKEAVDAALIDVLLGLCRICGVEEPISGPFPHNLPLPFPHHHQTFYYACKEAVDAALIDVLLGLCRICGVEEPISGPFAPSYPIPASLSSSSNPSPSSTFSPRSLDSSTASSGGGSFRKGGGYGGVGSGDGIGGYEETDEQFLAKYGGGSSRVLSSAAAEGGGEWW
ncbi:unnamed protein product [Closterium sp. Yama58-4]|nr:unnamed protein product [Closterium sp. Yama58-4]